MAVSRSLAQRAALVQHPAKAFQETLACLTPSLAVMAPSHAVLGTQPHTCATSLAKRWASPTRKSLLCLAPTLSDVFSRSEVEPALSDTLMLLPPSTQRAVALLDQRALQELAWQAALPGPRTG